MTAEGAVDRDALAEHIAVQCAGHCLDDEVGALDELDDHHSRRDEGAPALRDELEDPLEVRLVADVVQAQRPRIADQDAEDPVAARQVPDGTVGLLVDAERDEPLETLAAVVEDAERGIPRARELLGDLEDTVQEPLDIELGYERTPHIEQAEEALLAEDRLSHGTRDPNRLAGSRRPYSTPTPRGEVRRGTSFGSLRTPFRGPFGWRRRRARSAHCSPPRSSSGRSLSGSSRPRLADRGQGRRCILIRDHPGDACAHLRMARGVAPGRLLPCPLRRPPTPTASSSPAAGSRRSRRSSPSAGRPRAGATSHSSARTPASGTARWPCRSRSAAAEGAASRSRT